MKKIKWCIQVKNGVELVEPSDNLSTVYLQKSEDALRASVKLHDNRDWQISSCYYAIYFALYAVLMKIGVKCEVHACTIEFMKEFLNKHFTKQDYFLLKNSMQARIDAQYYVGKIVNDIQFNGMVTAAPKFFIKCKEICVRIVGEDVQRIREAVGVLKG